MSLWTTCMSLKHNFCMWSHPVTLVCGLYRAQLNLQNWVDWALLYSFAKSATSLEYQKAIVLVYDISRDFFRSRWASLLINLVYLLLSWPFYRNLKEKLNQLNSVSWTEMKSSHVKSLLRWSCAKLIVHITNETNNKKD